LIDEYRLVVHPVALGKGPGIFDGLEQASALKLVSSSVSPGDATAKIFRASGDRGAPSDFVARALALVPRR
jgi:dihydrofolate reductase